MGLTETLGERWTDQLAVTCLVGPADQQPSDGDCTVECLAMVTSTWDVEPERKGWNEKSVIGHTALTAPGSFRRIAINVDVPPVNYHRSASTVLYSCDVSLISQPTASLSCEQLRERDPHDAYRFAEVHTNTHASVSPHIPNSISVLDDRPDPPLHPLPPRIGLPIGSRTTTTTGVLSSNRRAEPAPYRRLARRERVLRVWRDYGPCQRVEQHEDVSIGSAGAVDA
ncbi:hypothetical protein A0H81_01748 [Grifola frondosa]|uniref:Uncharacterized protein n=1 Tax=Grifola frondosa TaxID=5627 RepID=A0A1C7MRK7_GRIFR|nr:hypothetical protein A0H81_01748 [Grifola frondosa]